MALTPQICITVICSSAGSSSEAAKKKEMGSGLGIGDWGLQTQIEILFSTHLPSGRLCGWLTNRVPSLAYRHGPIYEM